MVNLKGILPGANTITQAARPAKKPEVKSSSADDDRDAQGKREDQHDQEQHPPMDEENAQKALEAIRALPGIQANGLQVKIEKQETILVATISDLSGKVIRRIPEQHLWSFLKQQDENKTTGNLINKAM